MQSEAGKAYIFHASDTHFYLATLRPIFHKHSFIKINRLTSKITTPPQEQWESEVARLERRLSEELCMVMGVVVVSEEAYLGVVRAVDAVATINNQKVWCVKEVGFIPFKHKYLYQSINQSDNEKVLDNMKESILKDNFYFCYHSDLTLTQHKLMQRRPTEPKYFWNENMLKMFTFRGLPECWRIPLIQGHVAELHCENSFFSYYYCVISRRSKHMSGTRFHSRGIDANTHCANYVETEEVFVCHNYLFAHVSIRGSVPIFWGQKEYGADITFGRSDEENIICMQKHYEFLKREYQSNIITLNLLSKNKSPQKELKRRFELYMMKGLQNEPYMEFDLNEQIKDESSVKMIEAFMQRHGGELCPRQNFLCLDRYTGKLIQQQSVTTRINCLDCIDRTNVIMSRLGWMFLLEAQHFVNTHSNMKEKQLALGKKYRAEVVQLWVEIGNKISMIYCGTESVAAHLTKEEDSSFFSFITSGFRSFNRYLNASLNDPEKQLAIDYLLGNREQLSRTNFFNDNISKVIEEPRYCSYQQMTMYVLSWNCNTAEPEAITPRQQQKLFNFPPEQTDLVIVCLQEMVELSSFNVLLGNNETIVDRWRKQIDRSINYIGGRNGRKYVYLTGRDLVGLACFVFISEEMYNRVHLSLWKEVKTGFKNNLGNKGSIILFLQIDASMITIANCHLTAGQKAASQRLQDIQYIHNDAINDRSQKRFLQRSQYRFFIGDMNFRLEAKNQHVREILYAIEKEDAQRKLAKHEVETYLSALLQKDEFYLNNRAGILSIYQQGKIYFLPTYKYVKKEKNYDTKRTPSWCDRILFYAVEPKKLAVLKYWDVDVYSSDHKPVCGAYKVLIKTEDPDMKKKLIQEYMDSPQ